MCMRGHIVEISTDCFERFIQKVSSRAKIDADDEAAVRALPFKHRSIAASQYIVREGQPPKFCALVCEGYAYRQKLTIDGDRQIVMLIVPGDLIDLQNLFLSESDHDVQALTTMTIAEVPIETIAKLASERPAIARALWTDSLIEASIAREWLLNVGRRNAKTRIAHLLCEFRDRLWAIGEGEESGYELPMTQEQIGDALGLTPVHVNRMLQGLERDGLINRHQRRLRVENWTALKAAGQFDPRYLHLNN